MAETFSGDEDFSSNPLERQHQRINYLFGYKPWEIRITERTSNVDTSLRMFGSPLVDPTVKSESEARKHNMVHFLLFGWWTSLIYFLIGLILRSTFICTEYSKFCFDMSKFFISPIGKFVAFPGDGALLLSSENEDDTDNDLGGPGSPIATSPNISIIGQWKLEFTDPERADDQQSSVKIKTTKEKVAMAIFYLIAFPPLSIVHLVAMALAWFPIVFVPIAKVHQYAFHWLKFNPINLTVESKYPPPPGKSLAFGTHIAFSAKYFGYSYHGLNILLWNMLPFVALALSFGYFVSEDFQTENSLLIFFVCLVAVIPLCFVIGMSVSIISAQTSFAMGAVLNAFVGSFVELAFYTLAMRRGFYRLVKESVTGSLIGLILLLPGLAMLFGGIKHKEQKFNKNAAGVNASFLLLSVIGAFSPSVFYMFYGSSELSCNKCVPSEDPHLFDCGACRSGQVSVLSDGIYLERARPLTHIMAIILPLAYLTGLIFTLKTHSHLYEEPKKQDNRELDEEEEEKEKEKPTAHAHTSASWPYWVCVTVMILATLTFCLIADALLDALSPTLKALKISEDFAGLTFFALIPSSSELVNAAMFGLDNNLALSLEIGNVAAAQIFLIQIPFLVGVSEFFFNTDVHAFDIMFSPMDVFYIVMAVLILNYICQDGKSNYHSGVTLIIIYTIVMCSFYYVPQELFPNSALRHARHVAQSVVSVGAGVQDPSRIEL